MDYDDEKFDLSAFVKQLAKENKPCDFSQKIYSEILRVEQLVRHLGPGTGRVRAEGFPYLNGLNCLHESVLAGKLTALLPSQERYRADIQWILDKLPGRPHTIASQASQLAVKVKGSVPKD
jgi:hypothetical protein